MADLISLDEAKEQVRAQGTTAEDGLLNELIVAARQQVEAYCGSTLASSNATMTFPSFSALERLALAPVNDVTEIKYLDATGVEQTLDQGVYELLNVDDDPLRPKIRPAYGQSWPAIRGGIDDAVRVKADVGYATVPAPVIRAVKLLISHWYDNRLPVASDVRGTPTELPFGVTALLTNYRR